MDDGKIILDLGVKIDAAQVDQQIKDLRAKLKGKKSLSTDDIVQVTNIGETLSKSFKGAESADKNLNTQLEETVDLVKSLNVAIKNGDIGAMKDWAEFLEESFQALSKLAPKVQNVAAANQKSTKQTKAATQAEKEKAKVTEKAATQAVQAEQKKAKAVKKTADETVKASKNNKKVIQEEIKVLSEKEKAEAKIQELSAQKKKNSINQKRAQTRLSKGGLSEASQKKAKDQIAYYNKANKDIDKEIKAQKKIITAEEKKHTEAIKEDTNALETHADQLKDENKVGTPKTKGNKATTKKTPKLTQGQQALKELKLEIEQPVASLDNVIGEIKSTHATMQQKIAEAQQYKKKLQALGIDKIEGDTEEAKENVYRAVELIKEMGKNIVDVAGKPFTTTNKDGENITDVNALLDYVAKNSFGSLKSFTDDNRHINRMSVSLQSDISGVENQVSAILKHTQTTIGNIMNETGTDLKTVLTQIPQLLDKQIKGVHIYKDMPSDSKDKRQIAAQEIKTSGQFAKYLQTASDEDLKKMVVYMEEAAYAADGMGEDILKSKSLLDEYKELWRQILELTKQYTEEVTGLNRTDVAANLNSQINKKKEELESFKRINKGKVNAKDLEAIDTKNQFNLDNQKRNQQRKKANINNKAKIEEEAQALREYNAILQKIEKTQSDFNKAKNSLQYNAEDIKNYTQEIKELEEQEQKLYNQGKDKGYEASFTAARKTHQEALKNLKVTQQEYELKKEITKTTKQQKELVGEFSRLYQSKITAKKNYQVREGTGEVTTPFDQTVTGQAYNDGLENIRQQLIEIVGSAEAVDMALEKVMTSADGSGTSLKADLAQDKAALNEYQKTVNDIIKLTKDYEIAQKNAQSQGYLLSGKEKYEYQQQADAIHEQIEGKERLLQQIKANFPHIQDETEQYDEQLKKGKELAKIQADTSGQGKHSWGQRFKDAFQRIFDYTISYKLINTAQNLFIQGYQYLYDYDKALTNLRIVTGDTREETEKLLATYNKLGQELGATTIDVAEAANDWLMEIGHLYRNIYEINPLNCWDTLKLI